MNFQIHKYLNQNLNFLQLSMKIFTKFWNEILSDKLFYGFDVITTSFWQIHSSAFISLFWTSILILFHILKPFSGV